MLKLIGVSKSGYYSSRNRKPSRRQLKKLKVKEKIVETYNASHQIYGAPKITKLLNNDGITISEKTVGNYMREDGIKAIWVTRYIRTTIDPDFDIKLKNILDRNFAPSHPNCVWVTDITYCYTLTGFVLSNVCNGPLFKKNYRVACLRQSINRRCLVSHTESEKRTENR